MKLLYRLLRRDPEARGDIITVTSVLGIAVNLLIAAMKIVIGLISSSIAILSEGANNAADALSSVLTLIGTRLAAKHPDQNHPFGYRRIEYLTGLVVAVLILVTGVEMLVSAVKLVFVPEPLAVSYTAIAVIAVSAVVKFFLGIYTISMGRKTDSSALEAVGLEGRNDSFASLISIVSALCFLLFGVSLDAYAGIIISVLILRAGFGVLKETLSELIGRAGEKELAEKLYREIRGTDGVIAAADMMLHNYGPDTWSGSVNVEIDHSKTVGEVYQFLHALQLRILQEYAVIMVFGIYGVDNDNAQIRGIREAIGTFVRQQPHVKSFHAVYLEPTTQKLYCDLVVDYELKDWDALRAEFAAHMGTYCPQYALELTVETEYV